MLIKFVSEQINKKCSMCDENISIYYIFQDNKLCELCYYKIDERERSCELLIQVVDINIIPDRDWIQEIIDLNKCNRCYNNSCQFCDPDNFIYHENMISNY